MEGTMPAAPLEPTLPGTAYTTAESFALEKERIFSREWFCVGREEEVRNSGDYLHLDIAGESVLLVRTRQGELSAFYNVCRHRGCRLQLGYEAKPGAEKATTSGPSGTFPGVIRCPYHSWTYELDGRLRSAPFLNDQIDKADFSLFPIGVETWGGFVFLNLTPHEARERGYDRSNICKTIRSINFVRLAAWSTMYMPIGR
jgi:glycine betaine catabolism A